MSQIISLVKYDYKDEKLYEDNSKTIEEAFISEDCINIISGLIGTAKIYEEYDSDEFYEIDCIVDFKKSIELYENRFIQLREECPNIKNENIFDSINLFRTLTNVHHVVWLKNEKFYNDDTVIITLG